MPGSTPPEAVAVEVVATQPTDADRELIARLAEDGGGTPQPVAYIVKVALKSLPEAQGQGWALYLGEQRIPKYWSYAKGIYFKVFDERFLEAHRGAKLRFSSNGSEFVDTGLKLAAPRAAAKKSTRGAARLPLQADVLK